MVGPTLDAGTAAVVARSPGRLARGAGTDRWGPAGPDPSIGTDPSLPRASRLDRRRRGAADGAGRLPPRRPRLSASAGHHGRGTPHLQRVHRDNRVARRRGLRSLEAACKPSSVPAPAGAGDGHPSERPTRGLSEPPAAARTPPCALLFGLAPARACPFHSRSRTSGHRHCGAGPRLTADGCYPRTCSMELGLSSDAAFRPMRPRPSGRLQGPPFYSIRTLVRHSAPRELDTELGSGIDAAAAMDRRFDKDDTPRAPDSFQLQADLFAGDRVVRQPRDLEPPTG